MLYFQPDGKHVPIDTNRSLLDAAQRAGVEISSVCGGVGTCDKCKVIVRQGRDALSSFTEHELKCFSDLEKDAGYRLACRAFPVHDEVITIEIPLESRNSAYRLQIEGLENLVTPNPSVTAVTFEASQPRLDDVQAIDQTVKEALRKLGYDIAEVDHGCLASIAPDLREGRWRGEAILYNRTRLMALSRHGPPIGMAFDIGTTKLAGYLLDLGSGRLLARSSRINPQILYGEDVMSRLSYIAREEDGFEKLVACLRGAVSEMIEEACRQSGREVGGVREIVFVGNTLMHHLMMGLEPSSLAMSPYAPVLRDSYRVNASELHIRAGTGCVAYALPNVAGFVGADCVADVLATELDTSRDVSLVIDIGTNTELVLSDGENLWGASTASGPAFEGAHIKHGMRAMSGAVERVAIDDDLVVRYKTIDDAPPVGICGSGVIDSVAEMVLHGLVDRSGRMHERQSPSPVRKGDDCLEMVVVPAEKSGAESSITFTQRDVREIQKAKGAIATGITILMGKASVKAEDIDRLFVAGAFGTYVDVKNAMAIGMFPRLPPSSVRQVGNSAGTGARMCLVSRDAKVRADRIAKRIRYEELAMCANFQDTYIKSLQLAPL